MILQHSLAHSKLWNKKWGIWHAFRHTAICCKVLSNISKCMDQPFHLLISECFTKLSKNHHISYQKNFKKRGRNEELLQNLFLLTVCTAGDQCPALLCFRRVFRGLWGSCLFTVRLYLPSKHQLCLDNVVGGGTDEDSMPHVLLSPCFQILCLFGNLSSKSQVKKERKSKLICWYWIFSYYRHQIARLDLWRTDLRYWNVNAVMHMA